MARDSLAQNTFVAFDIETSGKYPMNSEICEIAAVKWRAGKVIDTYQSFIAVKRKMSDEVIAIHHITNEMLVGAPSLEKVLPEFVHFIEGAIIVAHHAPFDMGFIANELEVMGQPLPKNIAFCTSLMARALFKDSENHKLQTLIKFFNIEQGQAHRALDDSKSCLEVALKCFEKIGWDKLPSDVEVIQGRPLRWVDFSIRDLMSDLRYRDLVIAVKEDREVQIVYSGGVKTWRGPHGETFGSRAKSSG